MNTAALLRSAREPRVATITAYLVAITGAELLTAFVNAQAGAVLHALILFALLNHSMLLGPLPVPPSGALGDDPARVLVALLPLLDCVAPEFNQARFVRVEFQPERPHPVLPVVEEPFRI